MKPVKVLFLGTPLFARNCLRAIVDNKDFKVQAILTNPDTSKGRGMKLSPSPVKLFAIENNIKVHTPSSFKNKEELTFIQDLDIDVVIVIAYGKILPSYFLNWFPKKIVNIHTSLLPRWRGACPVQSSLAAGDQKTGVTLQEIVKKMDAGGIIHQEACNIEPWMDSMDVLNQMQIMSIKLLQTALPKYLNNEIVSRLQDESKATYCKKIQNEDLKINWSRSAVDIFNQIRAYVINGGSHTFYNDKRIKIFKSVLDLKKQGLAGQILEYGKEGILVACGRGSLEVKELQLVGKKKQSTREFINGFQMQVGEKFR